jgi:hypothetical protein
MRRVGHVAVLLVFAISVVGLMAPSALAKKPDGHGHKPGPYPPPQPATCSASPNSGPAGTVVTLSGGNWANNSTVHISFSGGGGTTAVADGTGNFSTTFTIPAVSAGQYLFTFTGTDKKGNGAGCSAPFSVPSKKGKKKNSAILGPFTPTWGSGLAGLLILFVVGLVAMHRRRLNAMRS